MTARVYKFPLQRRAEKDRKRDGPTRIRYDVRFNSGDIRRLVVIRESEKNVWTKDGQRMAKSAMHHKVFDSFDEAMKELNAKLNHQLAVAKYQVNMLELKIKALKTIKPDDLKDG